MKLDISPRLARASLLVLMAVTLAACSTSRHSGSPSRSGGVAPHYKVGKPYKVRGKWYHPKEDPYYEKVGIASWYGRDFHGKATANGEVFDMNRMSAAHTTLPMPSLVEVTNLNNGRRITVRLNDRGPFADNRIIDLSRAAARRLGFEDEGLARVRVRYVGHASQSAKAPIPGPHLAASRAENQAITVASEIITEQGAPVEIVEPVLAAIVPAPPTQQFADAKTEHPQTQPAKSNENTDIVVHSTDVAAQTVETPAIEVFVEPETQTASTIYEPAQSLEVPSHREPEGPTQLVIATAANEPQQDDTPTTVIAPTQIAEVPPAPVAIVTPELSPLEKAARDITSHQPVTGGFMVRIAALSKLDNIEALKTKLEDIGDLQVSPATTSSGSTIYRINMGPFTTRNEAEESLDAVHNAGYSDATIITMKP